MGQLNLGFFARLWLALILPWKVLFDKSLATRIAQAHTPTALKPQPMTDANTESITVMDPLAGMRQPGEPTSALQLLGLLQREGRFVDFLREDISQFSDAEVGAASRVVHAGCARAVFDAIQIEPVRHETEGSKVTLNRGFDATRHRLTGNVVGEPPYSGTLAHHGWQAVDVRLPKLSERHDARIIAPAEIEL